MPVLTKIEALKTTIAQRNVSLSKLLDKSQSDNDLTTRERRRKISLKSVQKFHAERASRKLLME